MKEKVNNNSESFSSVNILLIEANPGDARLIREVFKEGKIKNELTILDDGEEALLFLKKTGEYKDSVKPDLILLGLNLPKKNGRELLYEIKSDPNLSAIPVIMLVSSPWEEEDLRKAPYHANSYILKPVEADEFINVIKSIEDFWLTVVVLPGSRM